MYELGFDNWHSLKQAHEMYRIIKLRIYNIFVCIFSDLYFAQNTNRRYTQNRHSNSMLFINLTPCRHASLIKTSLVLFCLN